MEVQIFKNKSPSVRTDVGPLSAFSSAKENGKRNFGFFSWKTISSSISIHEESYKNLEKVIWYYKKLKKLKKIKRSLKKK
jgi:hypothetical protein